MPQPSSGSRHAWRVGGVALVLLLWMAPDLDRYLANADHGYQLSMARFLVLGADPVVDFLFHYGPMVALTSGAALWLTGSLVGETLICAFAYAWTLSLLGRTAFLRVGLVAGWWVPAAGLIFLARFYKWYFWLFPALALYAMHQLIPRGDDAATSSWRDWAAAGLIAGFCALYRLDLGIVLFLSFAIATVVAHWRNEAWLPRAVGAGLALVAGSAVPMLLWLGLLAWWSGPAAVPTWFASTWAGGTGVIEGWSRQPPALDGASWLSATMGLRLAQIWVPGLYLVGLAVGCAGGLFRDRGHPNARFILMVAIIGIGMLPQAFYRADFQHFLQALPAALVLAPLLWAWAHGGAAERSGPRQRMIRWASVAAASILVVASVGLSKRAAVDLSSLTSNPVARFRLLASGPGPESVRPLARVAREIQSRSSESEALLVIPRLPQLYFFAARPMSGVLNSYVRSILDGPDWREVNLSHIQGRPPKFVAAHRGFLDPQHEATREFRASQPELYEVLAASYTQAVFEAGDWTLLQREEEGEAVEQ